MPTKPISRFRPAPVSPSPATSTATDLATTPQMSLQDWGLLVMLSILWGGSFFFTEIALRQVPPFTLVLARVGFAAIVLWWVVLLRNIPLPKSPRVWLCFLAMGILNNLIPFCLIVWGQTQISSGLAAILNATTPLFTLIVAHFATRDEKLTRARIIGIVLGLGGVIVVIGPNALFHPGGTLLAPLAVLAAAFSYGCAGVFGRRLRAIPPILTATGQLSASSLLLILPAIIVDHPWRLPLPDSQTLIAIGCFALFSTALAYLLYFRLLRTAGATNLLLVTFLIPVSALFLGYFVLGEALSPRQISGMVVIGLGLATIDGRIWARWRSR